MKTIQSILSTMINPTNIMSHIDFVIEIQKQLAQLMLNLN